MDKHDKEILREALDWLDVLIKGWDDDCGENGCKCTYLDKEDCSAPARDALDDATDVLDRA